ncbi:MAG: hypothetical protein JWO95_2356, partial [Verrucomicrobiales bacterium]|nr:hypothetical protein [Verrucomicrobiales bacterium]
MDEQPKSATANLRWRWLPLVLVFLTILFVGYVRLRIGDTALERDEGEYAYGGQLILSGNPLYKYLYNIKLPGTYLAYAAMMAVFGQTPVGIHIGLALVNALSVLVVYLIGKKLSGTVAGVLGALFFAFTTLDPSLMGFAAQATHFVVLAALSGFYFLLRATESGRRSDVFIGGALMGLSFLCKQPGLFFGLMGFAFVAWIAAARAKPSLRISYTLGWLAPYTIVCAWMWAVGCFKTFWLWTTKYAGSHSEPLSKGITALHNVWNDSAPWMQVTACCALGAVICVVANKRIPLWKRLFLFGILAAGVVAVAPGFSFYRHYFIMVAPGIALVLAVAIAEISPPVIAASAGVLWTAWVIVSLKFYMFSASPEEIV